MLRFVSRRIAGAIPTLLIIITVSFFIVRLAPGGPFEQEQSLPPQVRANLERAYGLDQPTPEAVPASICAGWRMGTSGRPSSFATSVSAELIAQGLPVSLTSGLPPSCWPLASGVPLGVAAAVWRDRPIDQGITVLVVFGDRAAGLCDRTAAGAGVRGLSAMVAGRRLGARARHGISFSRSSLSRCPSWRRSRGSRAPVCSRCCAATSSGPRGRGVWVPGASLWRHALQPAMLPVVSYLGPATAFVVTGSLVVETVFGLPGTRALSGAGRDQPRLHAGDGHGHRVRRADAGVQSAGRSSLRLARSARAP